MPSILEKHNDAAETESGVLNFRDLKKRKGWPFTREWTSRLVKAGDFPKPFRIENGRKNLWLESDIDAYLADRAKRAGKSAPTK